MFERTATKNQRVTSMSLTFTLY